MAQEASEQSALQISGKPAWQRFLESSGGTALITTILGTVGLTILNNFYQDGLKEREKARASYQELLKQEHETVLRAFDLVGRSIAVSEDLISLTSRPFDPSAFKPRHRNLLYEQGIRMRRSFNETDVQWRREKHALSLQMALYHGGQSDVMKSWNGFEKSVTKYMACAETWYNDFFFSKKTGKQGYLEDTGQVCKEQKQTLQDQLTQFSVSIASATVEPRKTGPLP